MVFRDSLSGEFREVAASEIVLSSSLIAFELQVNSASREWFLDIDDDIPDDHFIGKEDILVKLKEHKAKLVQLDLM